MISRSLGHRAPLLWLVLPFIAGLALGKLTGWRAIHSFLGAASLIAGIGVTRWGRSTWVWAATVISSMLLAGLASYALHRARLQTWEILPAREAALSLRV